MPDPKRLREEGLKKLLKPKTEYQKHLNYIYNLEHNPEKLDSESEQSYNSRERYNVFRIRQKDDKNIVSKAWNNLDEEISNEPNYVFKTAEKISTSPIRLAKNLYDRIDLSDTNRYRSLNKNYKLNSNLANDVMDVSSIYGLKGIDRGLKALPLSTQIAKQAINMQKNQTIQDVGFGLYNGRNNKNNMKKYAQGGSLTKFDEGGSHESSPYGGIPIGGNNRVEQGETKIKNFIYSDRLYANEDLAKQFNLPGYIKGKTFANASKVIDQKFNGRSDIHSNATKKELLDRLSEAQEHLKQQEEQVNQSMQVNSQQGPEDMMNGQIPEGMEEYTNQQPQQGEQFAFGGEIYGDPTDPIIPSKKISKESLTNINVNDGIGNNVNSTVKPIVKIQSGVRNDRLGSGYYVYSKYPVQNIESDREFISDSGYGALRGTKPYQDYMKSYNPSTMTYGINKFAGGGKYTVSGDPLNIPNQGSSPYTIKTGQSKPLTQVVTNDAKLEKEIGEKNYSNNKLQPYVSGYNAIAPKISNSIYSEGNDEKRSSEIQSVNTVGNSVGSIVGGKTGGMIGNGVAAATGLYEMGSEAFGNSNVDTSGQHSISGASSGISAGSGALKGAGTGAAIGSYVGPWGTVIGAGVGAIVGGVSGFIGGKKDEDAQNENNARYAKNVNDKFSDHYAYGGNLKQYRNGGITDEEDPINPLFKPTNTIPQVGASTIKAYPSNASIGDYVNRPNNFYTINGYQSRKNINPANGNFGPKTSAQFRLDNQDRSPENIDLSELRKTEPEFVMPNGVKDGMEKYYKDQKETVINESKNVDKKENPVVKYLDKNGGKFLKYAPVAMNAYQLSQLKKPENKQLERLNDRYNPKYIDEAQLENIVRQEGNNQSSAIQQMGGSEGSLRNALLATGLNKTKSLSDSYMKANEFNRAEDEKAQEFNSRISEFNARTQHQESDNHERNDAAYRNEKSKYLSSIGTDLGEIGKEEVNKNQIATALGYTVNGDYVVNKKTGEKTLATDFYKMIESGKNSTNKEDRFKDKSTEFGSIKYKPTNFKIGKI